MMRELKKRTRVTAERQVYSVPPSSRAVTRRTEAARRRAKPVKSTRRRDERESWDMVLR